MSAGFVTGGPGAGRLLARLPWRQASLGVPYNLPAVSAFIDVTGVDWTEPEAPKKIGKLVSPRINASGEVTFQSHPDTSVTTVTFPNYITHDVLEVFDPGEEIDLRTGKRKPYERLAMKQTLVQPVTGASDSMQDTFQLRPSFASVAAEVPVYMCYRMLLQPNWPAAVGSNAAWRSIFAWKTGGDYRIELYSYNNSTPTFFWYTQGDNNANGGLPYSQFWEVNNNGNAAVPAPFFGRWFWFEVYWKRTGTSTDRFWAAADGRVICDKTGVSLVGVNSNTINRVMSTLTYTDVNQASHYPCWQMWKDWQLWSDWPGHPGVPCARAT